MTFCKMMCLAATAVLLVVPAFAQPMSETPGMSREGATIPRSQTPAGAAPGTVPGAVSGGAGPGGAQPGFAGFRPGQEPRRADGMNAGKPHTSMPAGSVAGDAPGMGAIRATRQ